MRRGARHRSLGPALCCVLLVAAPTSCGGGTSAPDELADGSPARPPPVRLQGVDEPAVLVRTRLLTVGQVSRASATAAACLQTVEAPATEPAVVRIGVDGTSVTTYTTRSHHALFACDGTGALDGAWCGTSYGRLRSGRLLDPRLDLATCPRPDGDVVAYVWIEPRRDTRFVAVHRPGFAEIYPTAGSLPVRAAATNGIDVERSQARFEVSEHGRDGRSLRSYKIGASVAG